MGLGLTMIGLGIGFAGYCIGWGLNDVAKALAQIARRMNDRTTVEAVARVAELTTTRTKGAE